MNEDRFKFRVWHKLEQKYISEIVSVTTRLNRNGLLFIDGSTKAHVDNFVIVEFCTGLKDKNGNLIYEGDIVIEGGNKGVVKYGTLNCGCCDGVYGWYFDGLNGQTDIRCYEFCEVIGNIHEQQKGSKL